MTTNDPEAQIPTVSRDRVAGTLGIILMGGFKRSPHLLVEVLSRGRDEFVKYCEASDVYGLRRIHYERIYGRLAKLGKRLGLVQ